ncbi:hypothetical protein ACQ86N_39775 [Puia sp. P3]|uniref:hypothetical protein n=1 Tax=Puia sp. P3 TaxID=3423952 RepID=UPI003D67EBAC
MNSPLLNDNDISGAKWILININSSEGEFEFTMDEVDIIQNYLLSQAGEHTDVILGLGYDNTLGASLGITLIATGFEHRDPFIVKTADAAPAPKKEEKILLPLNQEYPKDNRPVQPSVDAAKEAPSKKEPTLGTVSRNSQGSSPVMDQEPSSAPLPDALQPKLVDTTAPVAPPEPLTLFSDSPFVSDEQPRIFVDDPRTRDTQRAEEPRQATPFHSDTPGNRYDDEQPKRVEWVLSPDPEPKPIQKNQAPAAPKILLRLQRQGDTLQGLLISMRKTHGMTSNPAQNTKILSRSRPRTRLP